MRILLLADLHFRDPWYGLVNTDLLDGTANRVSSPMIAGDSVRQLSTQGGWEQQIPPHEAIIALGLPWAS